MICRLVKIDVKMQFNLLSAVLAVNKLTNCAGYGGKNK